MTEIILVMNGHVTKNYWKLMYGQINDTKHTKTFISRPSATRWTCGWSIYLVGDLYFFLPTEHESVGIFFFAQRLKNNFFTSILMGRSGNRKQDYIFRP